jgi:hypothetical protein
MAENEPRPLITTFDAEQDMCPVGANSDGEPLPGMCAAARLTSKALEFGQDAVDDGLRDGLSSFPAPVSIQPQVAVALETGGVISLQTDTEA